MESLENWNGEFNKTLLCFLLLIKMAQKEDINSYLAEKLKLYNSPFQPSKYLSCGCHKPIRRTGDECDCGPPPGFRVENVELHISQEIEYSGGKIHISKSALLPSGESFSENYTFEFAKEFEWILSEIAKEVMWGRREGDKKLLMNCLEKVLKQHTNQDKE